MNKLLPGIIAITVGIIMCGTLLVPVISDTTFTTYENQPNMYCYATTDFSDGIEYTINDDNKLCYNGTVLDINRANIVSDQFRLIYRSGGNLSVMDENGYAAEYITKFTINSDGTYSYFGRNATVEGSTPITEFAGVSSSGNYAYIDTNTRAYVNASSVIYTAGGPAITDGTNSYTSSQYWATFKGTVDNLTTMAGSIIGGDALSGSITTSHSDSTEYDGAIELVSTTATYTFGDLVGTGATPYYVPLTFTYTSSADDAMNGLLGVIPVITILVLLIVAVRMATRE